MLDRCYDWMLNLNRLCLLWEARALCQNLKYITFFIMRRNKLSLLAMTGRARQSENEWLKQWSYDFDLIVSVHSAISKRVPLIETWGRELQTCILSNHSYFPTFLLAKLPLSAAFSSIVVLANKCTYDLYTHATVQKRFAVVFTQKGVSVLRRDQTYYACNSSTPSNVCCPHISFFSSFRVHRCAKAVQRNIYGAMSKDLFTNAHQSTIVA